MTSIRENLDELTTANMKRITMLECIYTARDILNRQYELERSTIRENNDVRRNFETSSDKIAEYEYIGPPPSADEIIEYASTLWDYFSDKI